MEKSAFVLVHGFGFCAAFHAASSSIWSGSVRTESAYGGTMSRETVAPLNAKLYLLPAHRRSRQRSMTVLEGTAYVRTSEWLNFVVATSIWNPIAPGRRYYVPVAIVDSVAVRTLLYYNNLVRLY
jgi:hypothetical protein